MNHAFTRRILLPLACLAGVIAVYPASAQTVVKRASCAESDALTAFANPLYFHENRTTTTQTVTMQVIRDGCRPKNPDGDFHLWVVNLGGGGGGLRMARFGRSGSSMSRNVEPNQRAFIRFSADGRPGGTFDYVYSVD